MSEEEWFIREQVTLCPYDAVNWLAGSAPNRAYWKTFRHFLRIAIVALSFPLVM